MHFFCYCYMSKLKMAFSDYAAGLKPSDTVLVHAGASGVGTAAVQLIQLFKARSLITAGSQAKIDTAKSLGASEGFNYKEGPWADKVLKSTDGKHMIIDIDYSPIHFKISLKNA